MRNHIVISGTGRAGTTFLIRLLTHLGCRTGFEINSIDTIEFPIARGGFDIDIRDANAPYIVKSPTLCEYIDEVLASSVRIEHAIIPVRRFDAAAASRAHVQKVTTGSADGKDRVDGGLWDADKADDQAGKLRLKFTKLIEELVRHDIPMTFLSYPRLTRDPDYLYAKLNFLFSDIDLASFRMVFNKIVRPELVHRFTEDDR